MKITTQAELSRAFWRAHPDAERAKIPDYSGHGRMFCTDTRTAFCHFLDAMSRDGHISPALAQRATLKNPPRLFYINRHGQGQRETVDSFSTSREARAMVGEYRLSDPSAKYWISSRPCAGWTE